MNRLTEIFRKTVITALACVVLTVTSAAGDVKPGATRAEVWKPMLEGKRVALLSNHTGIIDPDTHTVDLMLAEGVNVTTLFSPEHGFRGTADAGEHVKSGRDAKTGLPIASMYDGKTKSPSPEVIAGFDALVVDLQDVGARFYTYHITMLDLMAACAKAGKEVFVFDRPNPLGMIVDGPVLDMKYASGVGRIPVPAIHGLTMGEIALMANGEGWLRDGVKARLTVVPVEGYTHSTRYELPVAPSPNLKSMQAIYLYPSLCLFEGTPVSVGRGTDEPFTMYGYPGMRGSFTFTPEPRPGAKHPPLEGRRCSGTSLADAHPETIIAEGFNPAYVIDAYRHSGLPAEKFFKAFFRNLAGTDTLRRQIIDGESVEAIKASWQPGIESFKEKRKPYLIYPE